MTTADPDRTRPSAKIRTRLFAALAPPPEVRERLFAAAQAVAEAAPESRLRVVPAENLHLTLRFYGEVPPETAHTLETQLRARFAAEADRLRERGALPPEIALPRLAARPLTGQHRMVWAEVAEGPGCAGFLAALAGAGERAALAAGLPPERRPFAPHVTLARLRRRGARVPPEALEPVPRGALWPNLFPVTEVVLLRSALHPDGAIYDAVASFPLE